MLGSENEKLMKYPYNLIAAALLMAMALGCLGALLIA
jgi:hypothetical protein